MFHPVACLQAKNPKRRRRRAWYKYLSLHYRGLLAHCFVLLKSLCKLHFILSYQLISVSSWYNYIMQEQSVLHALCLFYSDPRFYLNENKNKAELTSHQHYFNSLGWMEVGLFWFVCVSSIEIEWLKIDFFWVKHYRFL